MAWDSKCHSSLYIFQLCISLVYFAGAHKRNVIFGCVIVMLKTTFFLFFFPLHIKGWTKPNAFHVCITSYKLVLQDHQAFRRKSWRYLILDEAQNIKNFKSQRWQSLLNFNRSVVIGIKRWLITTRGTLLVMYDGFYEPAKKQ